MVRSVPNVPRRMKIRIEFIAEHKVWAVLGADRHGRFNPDGEPYAIVHGYFPTLFEAWLWLRKHRKECEEV